MTTRRWIVLALCCLTPLLMACSREAQHTNIDEVPLHPQAVEAIVACPPEALTQGDKCYLLQGVSYLDATKWFTEKLVSSGWIAPEPPDDEPYTYIFSKGDHKIQLTFFRNEKGTGLMIRKAQ